jgi:hypothetical protein
MQLTRIQEWLDRLPTTALIIACVVLGIAARALFAVHSGPGMFYLDEPFYIARALAEGRGFADAFREGQGPTAHLLPISPSIAGGVYAVLGIHSAAAEFVLACWSIGLVIGTYVLLFRAFEHLGSSRSARLVALAYACLVPIYFSHETFSFRRWDGGLAAFLCALFLERLLVLQGQRELRMRAIVGMCLLAALTFFTNPALGIPVYACAGIACWQRQDVKSMVATIALAACALALFIVPWALRNQAVLGAPILLRSNLGLELAISNYPGALDQSVDPVVRFYRRMDQIHPMSSDAAYQAMVAAGGEVRYSSQLLQTTLAWARANPGKTAWIAASHVRQFLVPEEYQFRMLALSQKDSWRTLSADLVGVLALVSIVRALVRRRPHWVYPTLLLLLPAVLLSPFQPVPRYMYLLYPLQVFCAADLLTRVSARKRNAIESQGTKADIRSSSSLAG